MRAEGTQQGTSQERLPQATHAVIEGADVVADVFSPGKAEAHQRTDNATLGGATQHLACRQDQEENADSLGRLLDDRSGDDGSHEVDCVLIQRAGCHPGVDGTISETGDDQGAAGTPGKSGDP